MTSSARIQQLYTGEAGERYFNHRQQRKEGSAQWYASLQFRPWVRPEDTVLDFGAGTGGILTNLACSRRIGIEVNEPSAELARAAGIEVHPDIRDIRDQSIDVVISHHALEHTAEPFQFISEFHRVLKPGGKVVIVVPCEPGRKAHFRSWREQLDVHLYSWNPLSLGNLVAACGFSIDEACVATAGFSRFNRWMAGVPPLFRMAVALIAHALGRFNTFCVATKAGNTRCR